MRKIGLFFLLATSAMPALAQSNDDGDREARREARAEARAEAGQERVERAPREERVQQREQRQREVQVERQERSQESGRERLVRYRDQNAQAVQPQQEVDGSRAERLQRYRERLQQQQLEGQSGRADRVDRYRQRQLDGGQPGGGLVQRDRLVRTIPTVQPEAGQVGPVRDVRRDGRRGGGLEGRYDRDGRRYDRDNRTRWTNGWRNDRRYDWRRHRDRNRSTFSIGFYFDPFGYNYRRFGIGSYLYPNYYQSNYWINDPWQYRLPPAYGPYRWVRYHNDAVLIDTYSGEVADVIYGFFW